MTITVIMEGKHCARKPHQCWHCYRTIPAGVVYGYQACKYDSVYILRWHLDCEAMATAYIRLTDPYCDEGYPPLRDQLVDNGEYPNELDWWRGEYPHVVCRMELTDQLHEVKK